MEPSDPLPLAVSLAGLVFSTILQLSPVPVMVRIARQKSVGPYRPDPFVLSIVFGIINGVYALYTNQITGAASNYFGLATSVVYLGTYIYYVGTPRKKVIIKAGIVILTAFATTGLGVIILTLAVNRYDLVEIWLGIATTVSTIVNFFGQLTNIIEIVRTKNAQSISIEMAIGVLLASSCWTIYAVLIENIFYITSGSLGILSGVTQIALKIAFRRAKPLTSPTPECCRATPDIEVPTISTAQYPER